MCIYHTLIHHEVDKLCICNTILNGIRKADCVAHTRCDILSVEDSQNLLSTTTYMSNVHVQLENQNIVLLKYTYSYYTV
jgi:hypothetical protein